MSPEEERRQYIAKGVRDYAKSEAEADADWTRELGKRAAVPPTPTLGQHGDRSKPRRSFTAPPSAEALKAAAALVGTGQRQLKVTKASGITMRATRWTWEEEGAKFVPLGGLTLLGGREGIGKSTWGYRLAALLTVGKLPGAFFGTPRSVVVVAGEDAWEQTIVPRLVAAGADLGRVFRAEAVQPDGALDGLSLPEDTAELTSLCLREDVALVLLDPLLTVVSAKLDTHKDAEVRKALTPMSRLAEETQVSVIGLIHVNKTQGNDLLTRLMASRAFSAVARAVLVCHKEDNPEELGRGAESFLFGQAKSNLGRKAQFAYRYSIVGEHVGHDDVLDEPIWSSAIRIDEIVPGTIDDLVAEQEKPKRDAPKTAEALEWLTSYLRDAGAVSALTGIPAQAVKDAAAEAKHSEKAVRTARERNGKVVLTSHNPNGPGTVWYVAP